MAQTQEPRAATRSPGVSGYDLTRIILGAILLIAAGLKGYELASGRVLGGDLLESRWFLIGLVEFEWAFGLWLLTGLHPGSTRLVALRCFAAFALIALFKALSGEASCGCFGSLTLNPWSTFVLDLAAIIALLRFRPVGPRASTVRSDPLRTAGFLTIAFWGGTLGAWAMANPHGDVVVLEPENWVGQCLPLLGHIDVGGELAEGRWTVLLYHHDCPACRRAIPGYERLARDLARRPGAPRIALIEMPPYASPGEFPASPGSPCILGRLDDSRAWSIATPTEIQLRDCVVMSIGVSNFPELQWRNTEVSSASSGLLPRR